MIAEATAPGVTPAPPGEARHRLPFDAVTLLSVVTLVAFALPTRFVVAGLGDAGAPVTLLSLCCLGVWAWSRLPVHPRSAPVIPSAVPSMPVPSMPVPSMPVPSVAGTNPVRTNPVRAAAVVLGCGMLAAVAAGWVRPLTALEGRNSDRSVIVWCGYLGVLLLCCDAAAHRHRLDALLRRVVWFATYGALVGIVQFFWRLDLSRLWVPPGLEYNEPAFSSTFVRSNFLRVAGTTMHPIEFSVVGAAILPLAIHFALRDAAEAGPALPLWRLAARWLPTAALGFSVPLAVSRAGIIGLAVVGLVLLPVLHPPYRVLVAALGLGACFTMTLAAPGLLGTLRAFFVRGVGEPSISARTDDYALVGELFARSPWFGQGFGTFVPRQYDFLDNQYLLTIVEAGLVGLLCLAWFLLSAVVTAQAVRRSSNAAHDRATARLAQALTASVAVHVATFAAYDAMVFRTTGLVLFLAIGAIGALHRLERR